MTPNTHSDTIAPRQKAKATRASAEERNNKAAACEAFDTLFDERDSAAVFDERDSAAVQRFWFPLLRSAQRARRAGSGWRVRACEMPVFKDTFSS